MIGYITVGTNDFEKANDFYDALFAAIDIKSLWSHGNLKAWGPSMKDPSFCLAKPFDGYVATAGNGTMVAMRLKSMEQVAEIYAKALSLGAKNEGEPGPRGEHGFYGCYFRDLDGNKLCFYCSARKSS